MNDEIQTDFDVVPIFLPRELYEEITLIAKESNLTVVDAIAGVVHTLMLERE
jgi:hypothetical protein